MNSDLQPLWSWVQPSRVSCFKSSPKSAEMWVCFSEWSESVCGIHVGSIDVVNPDGTDHEVCNREVITNCPAISWDILADAIKELGKTLIENLVYLFVNNILRFLVPSEDDWHVDIVHQFGIKLTNVFNVICLEIVMGIKAVFFTNKLKNCHRLTKLCAISKFKTRNLTTWEVVLLRSPVTHFNAVIIPTCSRMRKN